MKALPTRVHVRRAAARSVSTSTGAQTVRWMLYGIRSVTAGLLAASPAWASSADIAPFMRFPNASQTAIAFVARGELWTTSLSGGAATRLTHDPGGTYFPRFSPDGHWIAFTARRAGTNDVYVMPAAGGMQRRLTFFASSATSDATIVAWTSDSRNVVFLSSDRSPSFKIFRAFSVPVDGGQPQALPFDHSGPLSFGPDGHSIALNRIFRNALTKRYLGGQHQNIYTYDLATHRLIRITDWKGTDTAPMWFGRAIYFLSDRGAGFRANIWAYDTDTKAVRQITHFGDFDIDSPSLGGHTISFQQGGALYALDLPSERLRQVPVEVPDDGERTAPRTVIAKPVRVTDAMHGVDYALSPDGSRLAVSAHGDLFTLSADPITPWRNLTATPGADEDQPAWSPDGRQIAYQSDVNGEQQLAVRPVAGGAERLLTAAGPGYFYTPVWSPDGTQLIAANAAHELWLIPLDGGTKRRIAQDAAAEIRDASISPNGRWVAYSTVRPNRQRAIHLQELASGQDRVVSSPMESDRLPVFSADGRVLFFVSQRHEQPMVSDRDEETIIATVNSDGIYAATLDAGDPPPLLSPTHASPPGPVHIDLAGLMTRAVALPVDPAVIASLEVRGSRLFYETRPPQLIDGDLPGQQAQLHVFDLPAKSDRVIARGLDNHSLAAAGGAAAVRRDGAWTIIDTAPAPKPDIKLDPSGLRTTIDPRQGWREMLLNAWRLDRDVFFNRAMNGTDWSKVRNAYMTLVPHIGSEDDFAYLLGQMQGELASSHTFLTPGGRLDSRKPVETGLLGADYTLDAASSRYRFAHILAGDNTRDEFRSPLTGAGMNLHDGDFLLAVNGHELTAPGSPDALLSGSVNHASITVANTVGGPRRTLQVAPLADETALRNYDRVVRNRALVDRLSNGRIGYVALTDFEGEGWGEFVRQFYPQAGEDGLVIDVRWNLGGFTSQAVLEVLHRQLAGVFVNREASVSPLPVVVPPRTMVALMNWGSGSDGDQFPYYFRRYGLGPLVGTRSWGGVQGINRPWSLMDGTGLTIPKDSLADPTGHWIIENTGVTPDTVIDDRPEEGATGRDNQLETATRIAMARLATHPALKGTAPAPLPAYPPTGNVPGASFVHSLQ
jgi:tricorn protease